MTERRRGLVEAAAIAAVVFAGAFVEHARQGIELRLVALALLLFGPFVASALAALGRARRASSVQIVLALASATGLVAYPIGRWAHALAGLACLGAALPPLELEEQSSSSESKSPDPSPAPLRLEVLATIFNLAAAAAIVRAGLATDHAGFAFFLAVALVVESSGPGAWRERTSADVARRVAAFAFAGGTATLVALPPGHVELDFHVGDPITIVVGTIALLVAAWLALGEIARRLGAKSTAELVARRRRALLRAIALGGTLALTWALGELFFHVVPNDYRETTTGSQPGSRWHEPGERFVYEGPFMGHREEEGVRGNSLVWNQEGFHDLEHEVTKPKDRARVLVLGDSYVDGYMLPLDALFHRKLDASLARATPVLSSVEGPPPLSVETIAYGWAGWGQVQELDALRARGARFKPDLVVLEFLGANDVRNNQPELDAFAQSLDESDLRRAGKIAVRYGLWFTWFVCSKTDLLLRRLRGTPVEIDSEIYRANPGPRAALWEDGWKRTDDLFGAFASECERLGAKLVVVSFTAPEEIATLLPGGRAPEGFDMRLPSRRAAAICAKRKIPFVDLLSRFEKRGGADLARLHLKHDGHWSALGQSWAASETAHFLVEESDLWKTAVDHATR